MPEYLAGLFDTNGFVNRWQCGQWSDGLGWLHIVSDAAIFGAYTAIPCVLAYFIIRRRDVPFPSVLWLFVAFIFACGFGHLVEAVIFWQPVYRLAGVIKFATALVSWATVIALVQIVPQILHFPGLAKRNEDLRKEIEERNRAENTLRANQEKLVELLSSEHEARDEAERANRFKDEFLSIVSHELRSPLHAILGYAQLLQREQSEEEQREGLAIIERNAKVQAKIIEDLLDMGRIMSGKVDLAGQPVDMTNLVSTAVASMRPTAVAQDVRLELDMGAETALVWGDRERLHQVVWNLLTNAVKFTPAGGRVEVELERSSSQLVLSVSDTGRGISPEFLPYVFDRFRQADVGPGGRRDGLGLGLSIVQHLIMLHGGSIEAHSAGPGEGATFIINLPLHVDSGTSPTSAPLAAAQSPKRRMLTNVRVLVVDDEADARELIKRLLVECAATVFTAGSADEALSMLKDSTFDVLLTDIDMSGKNGYDLIHAVRALPPARGGRVHAAAITALAGAEDRTKAMLAGFHAYVTKPVDAAELIGVVESLVVHSIPAGRDE